MRQYPNIGRENPVDLAFFVNPITHRIHLLPFPVLTAITLCCVGIDVLLHGPALLLVMAAGGCLGLVWKQEARRLSQHRAVNRKTLLAIGIGLLLLVTVFTYPAHAQFFGNAETWMQSNFGADTGGAIPLVFNVLRGLFLLYVGISLVRVINATRQDEDWQTIARTPLIIIIAVTAGDILTTLITG